MNDEPDMRPLTPAELGKIVVDQRQRHGWTQATLAEISSLTERTIQRVEGGEPSSIDTRRALAGAFKMSDIDIFNKPWPIPNFEHLKAENERIERETVAVSIVRFTSGRQVRELAEGVHFGSAFDCLIELPSEAEPVWAEMQDYFRDYGDVDDYYSAVQKLEVNKDFQRMIDDLKTHGLAVGGGVRRVNLTSLIAPPTPFPASLVYLVIGPEKGFPTSVRVPRKSAFA